MDRDTHRSVRSATAGLCIIVQTESQCSVQQEESIKSWNTMQVFKISISIVFFFFDYAVAYGVPGPGIRSKLL